MSFNMDGFQIALLNVWEGKKLARFLDVKMGYLSHDSKSVVLNSSIESK